MCGTDPYTYGVSIIRKCDSIQRIDSRTLSKIFYSADSRNDAAAFRFIIIKAYFSLSQNTILRVTSFLV